MGIYLNPSSIGFKRSLNSEIYVDKTGLIEKTNTLLDTDQKFIFVRTPHSEKHYTAALHDYTGDLLLVGINYNRDTKKHECVIEKEKKTP